MRLNKNKGQLLIIFLAVGFFIGIIYENIISRGNVLFSELFLHLLFLKNNQPNIIFMLKRNILGQ